jgi:stage 0 sporulation protein B (sporulation initiation phosphotransferase)
MDAAKTVQLLRKMRHEFGNHLQVLSGYLELQQPEKVKEYVNKLILAMRAERKIFEITEGEVTIYLYEQLLSARDAGLTMEYKDIRISNIKKLEQAGEPLKSLRRITENINADHFTYEVVIHTTLEQDIVIDYFSEAFAVNPQRVIIKE